MSTESFYSVMLKMVESKKRKLNETLSGDHDGSAQTTKRTIGPSLPPSNDPEITGNGDDSDSDDIGPTNDTGIAATNGNDDPDSGDDSGSDDIGPVLPTGCERSQPGSRIDTNSFEMPSGENRADTGKNQRDEWMLHPPEKSDWTSKVDPTKLRNRKFQTGKSARAPSAAGGADMAWVENSEQKLGRKKDEVLGISTSMPAGNESDRTPKMTQEFQSKLQKFSEATRKDISQRPKGKAGNDDDDDPSMRPFDREKDIGTSKISNSQRREMMNRASDFGSRFSGGKML